MNKLETFLEEHAAKSAEQQARMSAAYEKNKKTIKLRKISNQKRLENQYKKWAKENEVFVEEEIKSMTFENVWKNIVDKFN